MTRRRWWLAGLGGLLLLVRAALPEVVRRVAESRASQVLAARVAIGDVDLGLLRGVVALEDVSIRPAAAPAAPAAGGDPDRAIVAWGRFAVNLRWLILPWKTVRFSSVELRDPQVALDRLADGELNLAALVPASGEPAEQQAEEEGEPWGFAVDRLELDGGRVRFRDFAVGDAEPVEIGLPTLAVRDVALRPGHYRGPARTSVDVRLDQGRLRANTRLRLRADGLAVATTLRARRLPLERMRLYVPDVGWRELGGELGASVVHRLDTGRAHRVSGTVSLDDVAVHVPDVEEAALAWKHLGVRLASLDLRAHRAAVDEVDLAGATVVVRPRDGAVLPVLATDEAPAPASPAAAGKTGPDAAPGRPEEPDASEPWRWSIATLRVRESRAHVLTADGAEDVGIELESRELAGDGDRPAATRLALAMNAARVALEGAARVAPPGFAGTLVATDLPVREAERLVGTLPPELLQRGVLGADLRLAIGSAASPPGDVTVAGTLRLADFAMQGPDPKEFAVMVAGTEVAIDELRLPRVLAPADDGAPTAPPIAVRIATLTVTGPAVQLTRTEEGIVLPAFTAAGREADAPDASVGAAPGGTPAAGAAPAEVRAASPGGEAAAPLDVTVAALVVKGGEVRVNDRTVKPFFSGGLSPLDVEVQQLRWPELAMGRLRLDARSTARGALTATGRLGPRGGAIEVKVRDLALEPFNPYAAHYSSYSIAGGTLTVTGKATFGAGKYDSHTALALDRFDLGGKEGDALFREQFGVPIEVALALLRDVNGRISLDVPVAGDAKGARVNVATLVAQALRKALVNALASPLKLVGAAFGGKDGQVAPAPIAFPEGRAEPTADGAKQVAALAGLLASRPGIGITLTGTPSSGDARWLHEQALHAELARPQGVFGAIGNLAQRGARERVRTALAARADGKEGRLEPEDERKLEEWLAERPKPSAKELRELVTARLERVAETLREEHGIEAGRVRLAEPAAEVRDGTPAVEFQVGAAGRPG